MKVQVSCLSFCMSVYLSVFERICECSRMHRQTDMIYLFVKQLANTIQRPLAHNGVLIRKQVQEFTHLLLELPEFLQQGDGHALATVREKKEGKRTNKTCRMRAAFPKARRRSEIEEVEECTRERERERERQRDKERDRQRQRDGE